MSLHDRIMGMELVTETNDCDTGYNYGIRDAADEAKEADELMAEMALALTPYAELEEMEGEGANVAIRTLIKYNAWKEDTK